MLTAPLAYVFRVKALPGKEAMVRQELATFVARGCAATKGKYALFQGVDEPTCFLVYGAGDDRAISDYTPNLRALVDKMYHSLAEPGDLMLGMLRQPDSKGPPDTTTFLGWLEVKTGQEQTARQALISVGAQTRSQEPGCLHYDLFQCAMEATRYLMYSVMQDQAAIAAHKEAPYFKEFLLKSAELFERTNWWRIEQSAAILPLEWNQVVGQAAPDSTRGNGFDNPHNTYVFPRRVFNGYLYVGTRTPDDQTGGCEVWRTGDGRVWEQVVGGQNPAGSGFGNLHNVGAVSLTVFDNHLYVGTRNLVDGSELWRSRDGQNWQPVVGGKAGGGNGFGDGHNQDFYSVVAFAGHLYIGTNNPMDGCEVWRSRDGAQWEAVVGGGAGNGNGFGSANNIDVFSIAVFNDYLYAGIRNDAEGGEIWRSADGLAWESVVGRAARCAAGFGNPHNIAVASMIAFGGYIHGGTYNPDGCELWRSADGVVWEQTVGQAAQTGSGFGLAQNIGVVSLLAVEAYLYAGTAAGKSHHGCEVWRSSEGVAWEQVVGGEAGGGAGFGDARNGGALAMAIFGNHVYIGTVNHTQGGEIWRSVTPGLGG